MSGTNDPTIDPRITALEKAAGELAIAYIATKYLDYTLDPAISREILQERLREARHALQAALDASPAGGTVPSGQPQ